MNSIFRKLSLTYITALVISLFFITMALTKAFGLYLEEQKKDLLTEQGDKIVKALEESYYWGGFFDREKLENEISVLDEYIDASFIYIDSNYKIRIISDDINSKWIDESITAYEAQEVLDGHVTESKGTLGGIFEKPVIAVGYPVTVKGEVNGAIFVSSPLTEFEEIGNSVYKAIIVIIFIGGLFGFIIIYFLSKRLVKPLKKINEAAKVIANGDFGKRVYVKGLDEAAQIAESLNDMAESLNEQEKRRREFISNISHDLRSPLTSMKGFVQAIIDGTISPEKQEHYLKIVLDESERLAALANNMVNVNSLSEGGNVLNLSEFDINGLIKKTIFNFENRIISKKINLRVTFQEKVFYVRADYEKIQRVIYNLVDNAVKFTDEGGKIFIETKKGDNKKIMVYVRDNGRGLSEKDKKRVFDRFYKADVSRGEDKKGSGIGLSIVKEFILAHGEVITLNSEINKGCEFVFSLPFVKNKK